MNPIISALAGYFARGQRVTRIQPDNRLNPKAIIVHLEGGEEDIHTIEAPNREEFTKLWKQASVWWHLQWEKLDE